MGEHLFDSRTDPCAIDLETPMKTGISWLVAALLLCVASSAHAEKKKDWVNRALAIQETIDLNAPIAQALWIGTHNSYNSDGDGYVTDWNQKLSLSKQLKQGVREVVLDVHWYNKELRMCHGNGKHAGCVAKDRRFKAGLRDIKQFLSDNPEAVILLKIEGVFGKHENRFHKEIKNNLGFDKIYTPKDQNASVSDCEYLNQSVTKAQVRAKGKNVIIIVEPNKNLCKKKKYYEIVFDGLQHSSGNTHKFVKIKTRNECKAISTADRRVEMVRAFDTRTKRKIGSGGGGIVLDGDKIDDFLACGLNVFEMYNYVGDAGGKKEKFIWSWDASGMEPNGSGKCAVLNKSSNKFRDGKCKTSLNVACQKDYSWCVTATKSKFGRAQAACSKSCGAGYKFATPWNKVELDTLIRARKSAKIKSDIHLNYRQKRGKWKAKLGR